MHNPSSSFDNEGSFIRQAYREGRFEENKNDNNWYNDDSNQINLKEVFERESRVTRHMSGTKFGVDECMIHLSGPISVHCESPIRLPLDRIEDPSKIVITKVAWGWDHLIVLLENGDVYVLGNNAQGQLNLDPKIHPKVENELLYHEGINSKFDVIDIGWGTNHSVFIVQPNNGDGTSRKIYSCGYHGCLGVDGVNEDEFRLQQVLIPGLSDYDNIEFLIWKFNSCAVLDLDNNLYYWGDEFDGFRIRVPEKKNWFSKKIVDLSFGFRHALALLENGSIYVNDSNGLSKLEHTILDNVKIVKIEAGCRHSLFLGSDGIVYGYGLTKLKNHNTERRLSPIELEDITDITDDSGCIDIFAGDGQSVAIDTDGLPYRWDGVTGKCEVIEDLGGKYIIEVVLANQNIIAVYSNQNI